MLWNCCAQYASKFGKLSSGHRTKKVSFHFNHKEGNAEECSNYCTIAPISHTSKVMLNTLQARLQQYVNGELPDVQAGFWKGRGTRNQIAKIRWIMEKSRKFQKKISISALLTMPKPSTVWMTMKCGKFWKRWNTRPPNLPPEKSVYRSGSNS